VNTVLRLYRQGLVRLSIENKEAVISLSAIPGSGTGVSPVLGYPFDLGGKAGSRVYAFSVGRETRILLTLDNTAAAVNPADKSVYTCKLEGSGSPPGLIPVSGLNARNTEEGAAWVVSPQGRVVLVKADMEPAAGFPRSTGIRLSAPPAAHKGKLFLCDDTGDLGSVYMIDSTGSVSRWKTVFDSPLRAPPSFLDAAGKTYAASYPKKFFGEIWLTDDSGAPYPGWPAENFEAGIAFGSPLLFSAASRVLVAFITQAGELTLFDENGNILDPFPIEIPGVFYLQPVFDGDYLWIIESEGTLYQVNLDGTVLSQRTLNLTVKEEGYITTADIDGDKIPEIFFSGEGNAFYGYTRNFSSLEGFPLPVWGKPVFGDFNGDGKLECIGVGMDNRLYRWQFK
jgi:hypothetical protein